MLQKYGISIPGVVWGFLLLAIGYLLMANFPNEYWIPLVVVLVNAILKFIEVNTGADLPDLPDTREGASYSAAARRERPSGVVRFLLG